jgi:hypothetical protein
VRTLKVSKEEFLKKGNDARALLLRRRAIEARSRAPQLRQHGRARHDASGRELQPLVVRYPVEKGGALKEVAYYTSAHPAVESPEIVRAGRDYVHER